MRTIFLLLISFKIFAQSLVFGGNTLSPQVKEWNFTKHQSNPLILKLYGVNNYEFYPPIPIKDGSTYYVVGKNNNETWGYSSNDGVVWSETGKLISKGAAASWDAGICTPAFFYKNGSDYTVLYNAYGDDAVYDYQQGIATKNEFTATFTKSGSNPVGGVSAYNTANGTSFTGMVLNSVVKVGETFYFFGCVTNQTFTDCALAYGTSSSFTNVVVNTKICTLAEIGSSYTWMQSIDVFKNPTTSKWILTFTMGDLINNETTSTQKIYCLYSNRTDLPIFTPADFRPNAILESDVSKGYENAQNYAAHWLRDIEGNLLPILGGYGFYYAGHQNKSVPKYTGVTCLAIINSIP